MDWPFRRTFERKRDTGNTDALDNPDELSRAWTGEVTNEGNRKNRIGVSSAVRIRLLPARRYDDLSAEAQVAVSIYGKQFIFTLCLWSIR